MSYTDLRDWLEAVKQHTGEVEEVKGASWNLEMSTIAELVYREGKRPAPALLFDDIPGYPRGFRTLFGMLNSPLRLAKGMVLPEDRLDPMGLADNWFKKTMNFRLIPPKVVKTGPLLENTDTGDKIDILKFPIPLHHEYDGGRYLGTGHAVIQKDPDEGWTNLGTYRVMVVDSKRLALHATPGKHGHIIEYDKFYDRNKVMPVAVATGLDPALWWFCCQGDTPWGTSEYDMAGAVKGQPIEVIEGPYTGLLLPARAEIVVEGECHPGEFIDEGPFGEWHGYYSNRGLKSVPEPVIRIKAVHYRNNPIITSTQPAVPPNDLDMMLSVAHAVAIRRRLEQFGIPGIKGVWAHYSGSGGLFNVISLQQLYSGHAVQAGMIAAQFPFAMGAYTVVVEEDIDPSDLHQVMWAVTTRVTPDRSIHIVPDCHTYNGHPAISPAQKRVSDKPKLLTASRVVIDACRDITWKQDWYPIARVTPELRNKIMAKFTSVKSLNNR